MPKKKSDDAIVALAERMLGHLDDGRRLGDGSYPPTLGRLASLCDVSPDGPEIAAAVKHKAFKARAAVASKAGPRPEAPVVLTDGAAEGGVISALLAFARGGEPPGWDGEDFAIPKLGDWLATPLHRPFKQGVDRLFKNGEWPSEAALLARRMLKVLDSQRRLGGAAYPPAFEALAPLCGEKPSSSIALKAIKEPDFTARAVVVGMKGKNPGPGAPVLLREDVAKEAHLPPVLAYAMAAASSASKSKKSDAFTPAELAKGLVAELRAPFEAALRRGMEREALPGEYAWILIKGNPHLFTTDRIRPAPILLAAEEPDVGPRPSGDGVPRPAASAEPTAPRDFGAAFRAAFEEIDRRNGRTNFVKLADLRGALRDFDRARFDAGLNRLRDSKEFGLDSHEGLHGTLTAEEREAGLREAGSLLVYVSRR